MWISLASAVKIRGAYLQSKSSLFSTSSRSAGRLLSGWGLPSLVTPISQRDSADGQKSSDSLIALTTIFAAAAWVPRLYVLSDRVGRVTIQWYCVFHRFSPPVFIPHL